MNNLEPQEWKAHLNDDETVILDVRTPQEHEQEVIPNSLFMIWRPEAEVASIRPAQ